MRKSAWGNLKLAPKLALFGWQLKDGVIYDKTVTEHPRRDSHPPNVRSVFEPDVACRSRLRLIQNELD